MAEAAARPRSNPFFLNQIAQCLDCLYVCYANRTTVKALRYFFILVFSYWQLGSDELKEISIYVDVLL